MSNADLIVSYLKDRPFVNVLVQNMFDDLGLYATLPNGKRSYSVGAYPIRQVLYGLTYGTKPRQPLKGVAIISDSKTPRGNKSGTAWAKVVLRYTPPAPPQPDPAPAAATPTSPAEPESKDEAKVVWEPVLFEATADKILTALEGLNRGIAQVATLLEQQGTDTSNRQIHEDLVALLKIWGEATSVPEPTTEPEPEAE